MRDRGSTVDFQRQRLHWSCVGGIDAEHGTKSRTLTQERTSPHGEPCRAAVRVCDTCAFVIPVCTCSTPANATCME